MNDSVSATEDAVTEVAVLLYPRFVMNDLLTVINWLQAANECGGEANLFRWRLCSSAEPLVIADNGMVLSTLVDPKALGRIDQIIVLASAQWDIGKRLAQLDWSQLPVIQLTPDPAEVAVQANAADTPDELMASLVLPRLSPAQAELLLTQNSGPGFGQVRVDDGRIHRALQLMRQNLSEPLQNRELARQAHLSVRQLERLFRRYFDETPARYYLRTRLQSARRLLQEGEASVKEVAAACGFASQTYFSKQYKARFGITPGEELDGSCWHCL